MKVSKSVFLMLAVSTLGTLSAHASDGDLANTLGTGSKFAINKVIDLPANNDSVVIPRDRAAGAVGCELIYAASDKSRFIPAGRIVVMTSLRGNSDQVQYSLKDERGTISGINCTSGTIDMRSATIGQVRQALGDSVSLSEAAPEAAELNAPATGATDNAQGL